jgi:MFS family permease
MHSDYSRILTVVNSNLAQAELGGLPQDLGLHGTQFNTATSILFVGYLLMQLPSNLLFTRVRPALFLPTVMIIWGTISGCQAATQNFGGLLATRFLLGFAEAPYFPGAVYMMSTWYTRSELSKRFAFFYAGPALANMFGGLIAAGVLDGMDGYAGLAGWRWLFIIEAIMTVVVAAGAYFVLPNFPHSTTWLSPEERAYAAWRIERDIGVDEEVNKGLLHGAKLAVMDYRTWVFVLMQHCILLSQTVTFFFPSVVDTLGYSNTVTLLLTAPVWLATFILNLFVMWSASRTNERTGHLCLSMLLTIVGNIMLFTIHLRGPRFFAMFLMAMGAQPAFMIVLTWVPNTFPRPLSKRSAIVALVNMIGNTSNIYGSYLYPTSDAPQYVVAGATIAGVGALCMLCAVTMRFILVRENKKLDEVEREGDFSSVPGLSVKERERRDLARTSFRYLY